MESIPNSICEKLRYYVYLYVDPRDQRVFYVGKGKGNRVLAHLDDTTETEKAARITELRKLGLQPVIELLKYDLTESEAYLLESATIELLSVDQLTNRVRGHHADENGRGRLEEIVQELDTEKVEINQDHKVILINVSRLYQYGMNDIQLYDVTRGVWKVGPRRGGAQFAFCVHRGIVRAVYSIADWLPAGSTMTSRDYAEKDYDLSERFEFVGKLAPEEVRRKYVGKSVTDYFAPGSQNPIKYVNC